MTGHRTVVLDNEAIQALMDTTHHKHRRVISAVELVAERINRQAGSVRVVVPTTVRVESAWDRRAPSAAALNRMRIRDAALDGRAADRAALVRSALGVSVADAHIAAVLGSTEGPHAVITSDRKDLERIADHLGMRVNVLQV